MSENPTNLKTLRPDNPYDAESFLKNIPGRKYIPRTINDKITPSGDLQELRGINAIVKNVQILLFINKGSYPFDPDLGLGIQNFLFEPSDERTRTTIQKQVTDVILNYEPRANATVNVTFFSNIKGFNIRVNIKYEGEERNITIPVTENLLK